MLVTQADSLVSSCETSCCATYQFKYKKRDFLKSTYKIMLDFERDNEYGCDDVLLDDFEQSPITLLD